MPDPNYTIPSLDDDSDHALLFKAAYALWLMEQGGGGGGGTVTSVGLSLPASVFSVSGSPVTGAGTLSGSFQTQAANTVFAGPSSGGPDIPSFRALASTDFVPAGSDQQIQYNDNGTLGASAGLTYFAPATALMVGAPGVGTGSIQLASDGGGDAGIAMGTAAGGTLSIAPTAGTSVPRTATFPNASGVVLLDTAAQTVTGKVISGSNNTLSNIATTSLTGTLQAAQMPALTGDVTNSAGSLSTTIANNAVTTAKIANANVTYAKLPSESASTLLGRGSASGAGDTQPITLGAGLAMAGTVLSASSILQVVAVTPKTDTATGSNNPPTWSVVYSGSITLLQSSSRVIMFCTCQVGGSAAYETYARLERSGTPLVQGDAAGSRTQTYVNVCPPGLTTPSGTNYHTVPVTMIAYDTPGAGTHQYDLALAIESGGTWTLNRSLDDGNNASISRGASTMFLIEIA